MNYIQYMQEGGDFAVQEGTLRVDPQTNRTQTYKNGQWQDNVIVTPWSNQGTNRMNSGQQEVYFDGKWIPVHDQKWHEKLKEEDWYTLGSIVGDLASLGLSFTGFSPAAAATGALSTTSQLIGDIKRDGFQAKDLGWAALGYGLDAISLVPFAGAAAQMAKAAPKLAKAAPIVLGLGTTALSGLGIGTSIPAFKKVVNGEKLTMDDYRLMTNALMSIVGLGRQAKGVYDVAKGEGFLPVPENLNNKQEIDEQLRIKRQTEERLARQEERLNEEWEQRQASNPNWKFTLAQAAADVQMRDRTRMLEQTGDPKAYRNSIIKRSPLGIKEIDPRLDHIMLINRVGGSGQILWQNGALSWSPRNEYFHGQSGPIHIERPTVHFTTDHAVYDHFGTRWGESPTTIMFPFNEAVKSNGVPGSIEPMDTYWNNIGSMQIPAGTVKVFTGDLQEATKARLQGAQVIFSKEVWHLNKKITEINKRLKILNDKYRGNQYAYSDEDWKLHNELFDQLDELVAQNKALHNQFISQNQRPLTVEDYQHLSSWSGIHTNVRPAAGDPTKLSYELAPSIHSHEWFVTGLEDSNGNYKTAIEEFTNRLGTVLGKFYYIGNPSYVKKYLLSDSSLLILQQTVQKVDKNQLKTLQSYADRLPNDWPNVDKLRKIAAGQIVYKYASGGKLNYLNYFQYE